MSKLAKIITSHICPPVPSRQFDWSATEDGYEPGDAIGYGATEDAAIADLRMQLLEAEAERNTELAIRVGKQQRDMLGSIFNHMFGSAK